MPRTWEKMGDKPNSLWTCFKDRIEALWKNGKTKAPIHHPIKLYDIRKWQFKHTQGKNRKRAGRAAFGDVVVSRIINGPELNILLLGFPFLIHFAGFRGRQQGVYKAKKKYLAKLQKAQEQETIELELNHQQLTINDLDESMSESLMTPMPHGPLAADALQLYRAMIQAGMSQEGAYKMASGEVNGQEITEVFSDEDSDVLIKTFGNLLVFPKDHPLAPNGGD